jgi:ABC-type transport system substrate-binding protein
MSFSSRKFVPLIAAATLWSGSALAGSVVLELHRASLTNVTDAAGLTQHEAGTILGVNRSLITNQDKPPFDSPDLRRAMALSFDRKAFIDIVTGGRATSAASCNRHPKGFGACHQIS